MRVDYGIKIPIEVVNEQAMKNVYESLRGIDGATSKLTATQREFAKAVREGLNEGQSYNRVLGDMRKKSSDASEGFKQMAGGLQEYIARTKEAEASTSRL